MENKKYKKWHLPFLLFLVVGSIFIIRNNQKKEAAPYQTEEGVIFGTVYHVKYQSEVSYAAEITETLQEVDKSLSMFNPMSTISLINKNESDTCDAMLREVLDIAMKVSKQTEGAFDVTVAPLVNAWGFGFKNGVMPDSSKVDSILQYVGWQKIKLANNIIKKECPETILDLSAVAKGFGVDKVAELLRHKGVENLMVEIGGEIVTQGHNAKGEGWSIGINKPVDDPNSTSQDLQEIIKVHNCCMATSGNYRNYYVLDGKKIAHTIDPHSGYPVQHSILSSTVFAPTCAMADAYATSFMVMGLEKAQKFLERHSEIRAYFIYGDEEGNYKVWTNR